MPTTVHHSVIAVQVIDWSCLSSPQDAKCPGHCQPVYTSRVKPEMPRLFTNEMLGRSAQRATLWLSLYAFGFFKLDLRWLLLFLAASYLVYIWRKYMVKRVPSLPIVSSKSETRLPAWVTSPDAQRAEWVNAIFRQLWPHVEEFLQRAFKDLDADEELLNGRIK